MSRKTLQVSKFAEFDVTDLDSATKSIAQSPGDYDGKWVTLRIDGSVADIDSAALEAFDAAVTSHVNVIDVVLVVDSKESSEVLAAWEAAKEGAPASVLSKLPDADGRACRYVALTGKRVAGSIPSSDAPNEQLNDETRAILRTGVTEFVRENAQEVRDARDKVESAVSQQVPAKAFSGSITLDSAIDRLAITCESDLANAVTEIDLSADATDTPDNPVAVDKLQTARDTALGDFAAASSKSGLGKLLAKSKIKSSGDQLLAATDSLVGARASELIEALVIKAEPLLAQARADAHGRDFEQAVTDLSKATDVAAAGLSQTLGIDLGATRRPWTTGVPGPRHYVIAEARILDQLDLSVDATKVPAQGFDGVYVLQAQYALSTAALSTS